MLIYSMMTVMLFDISPDEADCERADSTVWDLVTPSIAQDDAMTKKLGFAMLQDNITSTPPSRKGSASGSDLPSDSQSWLYYQAASRQGMVLREYCEHIRNLNEQQCHIVMFNHQWCKTFIHQHRLGKKQDGYKVFLSGCGGTGKSHVVRLIQ